MKSRIIPIVVCLGLLSFVTGCFTIGEMQSRSQPDKRSDRYTLTDGTLRSATGCVFEYRVYEPELSKGSGTIMLGHGFLRNQNNLIDLSRALANSGMRTVTLNFCNMRPWKGNHAANANDMRQLALHLGSLDDMVFGGFSAGGLAAILAADQNTKAIFLMDFVDQAGLGAQALQQLHIPVTGFYGPASACNANNSGVSSVAQYLVRLNSAPISYTKVESASHCEFESPTDWLCKLACADDDRSGDNESTRRQIISESVQIIKRYIGARTMQDHS